MSVWVNKDRKGISLKITDAGFVDLAVALDATPEQIDKAAKIAVSNVTRWAHRRVASLLSSVAKFPQDAILRRTKTSIQTGYKKGAYGSVWIGLFPMSVAWLNPVQTPTGVQAGGRFFRSAFIVDSLHGNVFKRRTASRLPIDKQKIEFKDSLDPIFEQVSKEAAERFKKELSQQLKWLTN
ncbi:MAG TPA: hypothetical protein VNQ90_02850 [Chthoniobacteraceae bacterium]|nr:hypothetical protein [Chthoniobacteraceae bacterium]